MEAEAEAEAEADADAGTEAEVAAEAGYSFTRVVGVYLFRDNETPLSPLAVA
jgi:hypothetical protein